MKNKCCMITLASILLLGCATPSIVYGKEQEELLARTSLASVSQSLNKGNEGQVKTTTLGLSDDEQAIIQAIGKGKNFKGKLYLNYIRDKITEVFKEYNGDIFKLLSEFSSLISDQISEVNVKERFDVSPGVIKRLITISAMYDIAFAKDSCFMSLLGAANDGTAPAEPTGFYPNTTQLEGTTVNKQDGKLMTLKSYYVDQKSDVTVMIHGGFRGNWNLGTVTDEYNIFYNAGYNLLFVDPRATGNSGGDYVTYGQYESDDVLYWINREVGTKPTQKILLYGGSMEAAAMMSTLAKDIPANVKGIIENCGFKSIDEQLRYTYKNTVAPLLGSIFGEEFDIVADEEHEDLYMGLLKEYYFDQELKMNVNENLPEIGMATTIPKLIIHGDADQVVPHENADELYDLSGGYKVKLIVAGAGHGEAQSVDPVAYQTYVTNFLNYLFGSQRH